MAQPKLSITKKATITVDARTAKPVDITVPDAAAKAGAVSPTYTVGTADGWQGFAAGSWTRTPTSVPRTPARRSPTAPCTRTGSVSGPSPPRSTT
ncbi:hypothetical protein GCM10010390_39880 [Streptomyces mordarskii]|uniref:Uncharacterized protein n=1 Tax=Streptomyces mordarskii TaxID=1226758 RepID=A0ABP3N5R2_9ACTN